MKFIILGLVIYVIYKYVYGPTIRPLPKNEDKEKIRTSPKKEAPKTNEGEYIEYEEVD